MNTLKLTHFYLCMLIVMLSWKEVLNISGLNDTEYSMCSSILPRDTNECSNSYYFDTVSCCTIAMNYPYPGLLCMAMAKSAAGTSGNFSRQLPTNVYIQGVYACSSEYLNFSTRMLYVLIIYLFISLL